MSTDEAGNDRRGGPKRGTVGDDRLTMRVVEYPDAPDRCTIFPSSVGEHERMTHWLSADRDAFRALDRWR